MSIKELFKIQHTLTIEKLVFKGMGLATLGKWTVFIPNTLPGEVIKATILYKKKKHLIAKKDICLRPSPFHSKSPCQHANLCGGCQLISVDYAQQHTLKTIMLSDLFEHHPTLYKALKTILNSPQSIFYRNKMDFSFGTTHDKKITLGLKKRDHFDTVIPIKTCLLQSPTSNKILKTCVNYFQDTDLTSWDYHAHTGDLRYLMIRESKTPQSIMLNFTVSRPISKELMPLIKQLKQAFPCIQSIYMSINDTSGDRHVLNDTELLYGTPYITESLGKKNFRISPYSFFQTNSLGAELLYKTIFKLADLAPTDRLLDLYCGTGSIGLYGAHYVKELIGIEENPSSIKNAIENAISNKISHAQFIEGRVKNILKNKQFFADCIIIDPPRSGIVPKALRRIINQACKKIIYVSCNPSTFIRDALLLLESGYIIKTIQPVDMFPNTYHCELIAVFHLEKN